MRWAPPQNPTSGVYGPAYDAGPSRHAGTKAPGAPPTRRALGLAQARSLVDTLAGTDITAAWCSPSVRCRQSVEPLATALELPVPAPPCPRPPTPPAC